MRESLPNVLKALEQSRKAVALLVKAKGASPAGSTAALDKAVAALQELELAQPLRTLSLERAELIRIREASLKDRREDLIRSAKEAGWLIKRLKDYDFACGFRVNYKMERVTLHLGSERFATFEEVDGAILFSRLQAERSKLEDFPFTRASFIELIKDSIHLARRQGKDRDGKVPIRTLYPLVVLARHSRDARFVKHPTIKFFTEYSIAQFVYDLARFGREGWETQRGERLCNQAPNMASIAKGASVTLPSLEGDGSGGPQLGAIWVDKT